MKQTCFLFLASFMVFSCQQKPTKVVEESANVFDQQIVLIDTRKPLDYESFHVEGSYNLWWEDFVILQNPGSRAKNKKRIFDPDLRQTIERLAKKGVSPNRKIYLIGSTPDSVENKKWRWLLSYLEVTNVQPHSVKEISKTKTGRFAEAKSVAPWVLKASEEYQNEFIIKKAPQCFVQWSDRICQ